jgi:hypothetical protein
VIVRWHKRERELTPVSLSAAILQFLLTVVTLPAVKVLPPTVLYRPEIGPDPLAFLLAVAVSAALLILVYVPWSDRIGFQAASEQQREAERHA